MPIRRDDASPIIQVITQRSKSDCGVSCLAMVLGVSYEDALVAVAAEAPRVMTCGVWLTELERAAVRLGRSFRRRRKFDMEDASGILNVLSDAWPHNHLVVLLAGMIFDTDGTIWEAQDFLKVQQARPGVLLETT